VEVSVHAEQQPAKTEPSTSSKSQPTKESKAADKPSEVSDVYTVGEELGRGAFSVVKKGKHRKTGQLVAIKIIEKKFVEQQDLMLLAREIEIMKKVHHANVL